MKFPVILNFFMGIKLLWWTMEKSFGFEKAPVDVAMTFFLVFLTQVD